MRKLLIIIGLMMVMAGCNNPLKKSISEELTMKEVKSISKKDPLFLAFYDRYFENRCYEGFLKDKTAQVLYSDITYKRFYDYIKTINDDGFINVIYDEAEKEWDEKFGYTEQKFDSIINYWRNYAQEKFDNDKYYQYLVDIPVEVRMYNTYKNRKKEKELNGEFEKVAEFENFINMYKVSTIKRYIDEDYVSLDEYKTTLQNIRMEKTDPLSYNFQKFIVDCKSALK